MKNNFFNFSSKGFIYAPFAILMLSVVLLSVGLSFSSQAKTMNDYSQLTNQAERALILNGLSNVFGTCAGECICKNLSTVSVVLNSEVPPVQTYTLNSPMAHCTTKNSLN
jgi:hypothetical protein